ncbi:MAG: hypothetical protein KDC70_02555, partial [Saprospiraceae bacterium]|nr:hypothetical protein [Saprospiraceae bacterium]
MRSNFFPQVSGRQKAAAAFFALLLFSPACKDNNDIPVVDEQAYYAGGETTVFGEYSQVFQQPASNL